MRTVLFVVFLDIVGFGIVIPVFPFIAVKLGAGPGMTMVYIALYMVAMTISAPLLGKLSDRFGRKPIIAYSLIGSAASYALLAYSSNLLLFAISRILGGFMAGSFSAAQALITDLVTEDDRAKCMGYLGAAISAGYVIGPAIGSLLGGDTIEHSSILLPGLIASGLSLVAFVAVLLFVDEGRDISSEDSPSSKQEASANLSLKDSLNLISQNTVLINILLCALFFNFSTAMFENFFPLWAEHFNVIRGPRGLLPMILTGSLVYITVQAVLFSTIVKRFDGKQIFLYTTLGMAIAACMMMGSGNLSSPYGATISMACSAFFSGIFVTYIQVVIADLAQVEQRGFYLGMLNSIGAAGRALATLFSGFAFAQIHPHATYIFSTSAAILAFTIVLFFLPRVLDNSVNRD